YFMLVMSSSATVFAGQRTPKLSDPEWPNKQWKAAIQFSRDNDSKRPIAAVRHDSLRCNAASQKRTLDLSVHHVSDMVKPDG
ncbi:MAG: hypothetical protein AAGH17_03985, partial [Pseudomonadota bacterium]